ncbi:NAD(P)-dependent oxidoreductase [Streptomyces sp. NBC_01220]|uniref:NAD-dependent epimerase/dehydratase family protein n=1 Tax=Streptomyces sp. NBC_01220 TaxID=2903781 RepID=UPI00352DDE0C|nr:NAD(P)-dependent oxidoreductase [Streptomyces sp. NBC_01220]
MTMRIFLAGATGIIGRHLLPLLLADGHHVTGTSQTPQGAARLDSAGATGIRLDVFDRDSVGRALAEAAPEVVIHQLTALSGGSSADNARMRRAGTRSLVDAARAAGVRRIVAQSISWAYEPGEEPATEAAPLDVTAPEPRATTITGIRALEETVTELPEHVILRYGTLYGPGTWYAPGALMAAKLHSGELVANNAVSSFVHIDDAARAAVSALSWPSGPVNITDDEPAPAHTWLPILAAALGAPAPARTAGRSGWERGAANSAAHKLGWRPEHSTWRDGFDGR